MTNNSSINTLVKWYWVSFNSTITIAFFITAFYWTLLSDNEEITQELDFDPVLDVFVHGINSVVMFCLLVTSRQPTRVLHFYVPLTLGIVYMLFSLLYYFFGGLNPFGGVWIYPMLDWSEPGPTILLVVISALLMIVVHFVVVSMTLIRDAVTKSCKQSTVLPISDEDNGNGSFGYWFIYLTHWGLMSILFATGFATAVSARCYLYGPISTEFKLPWYVKIYWTLFNIATPLAFLITIFYWTVLYEAGIEEELNHGLDVAVHGLNSLVMFLLLCSSAHPGRLLHIYQPLVFATIYMLFSVIYHAAGGTDQKGNAYIYPVVNWSEPGTTVLVVFITGLLLVVLHLVTLGLSALRDLVATRLINRGAPANPNEGVPLRQPVYA
ncbi:unnamed protein product [Spodoptera exigua]|nr:unnamed protein product [Spodoptera exigua]